MSGEFLPGMTREMQANLDRRVAMHEAIDLNEPITLPVPPAEDITAEALAVYYERVDQAVKDTTAFIAETREFVRTAASDAEVRRIARHAARYALGLSRRPTPSGGLKRPRSLFRRRRVRRFTGQEVSTGGRVHTRRGRLPHGPHARGGGAPGCVPARLARAPGRRGRQRRPRRRHPGVGSRHDRRAVGRRAPRSQPGARPPAARGRAPRGGGARRARHRLPAQLGPDRG